MQRRWWRAGALVLLVGGCDAEEVARLAAAQTELDSVLIAKQTAVNQFSESALREKELEQLVAERSHADLGADPRATLQQAVPVATQVTVVAPGQAFDLAGSAPPVEALAALSRLGREQPGLQLSHLSLGPSGFAARISIPSLPVPPSASPPPAPWVPPALPPEPMLERSRARQLRQRIAETEGEIARLNATLDQLTAADAAGRRAGWILREASVADRLPYALDSAAVFFSGSPPWFTEADLTFRANEVVLTGPDPGAGPDPARQRTTLRQWFAEPHVERTGGRVTFRLTRLSIPIPGLPPVLRVARPFGRSR